MTFAASPDAKLTAEQRRSVILQAGVGIANEFGLTACKTLNVAAACAYETSIHSVRRYFLTKDDLWAAIARHPDASKSVRQEAKNLGVI